MRYNFNSKKLFFIAFFLVSILDFGQSNPKFKVVLDAGHGGKDSGTKRGILKEKDIALDVVLKIGKILEQNSDILVIYTRKTDEFIELRERAKIANKAKANLFISVHCNGVKSWTVRGTETFVMGMSRTDTNLDIAKKENGVIFLEEDYKEKYKGFDPNNPETYVAFKILQEESLAQSILLASSIENNFVNKNNRFSRGVKQQPIWVLDATTMPGVLIELGFISNAEEGEYVSSEIGKDEMSISISDAIISYKNLFFNSSSENSKVEPNLIEELPVIDVNTPINTTSTPIITTTIPINTTTTPSTIEPIKNENKTVYKVQLAAGSNIIDTKPSNFKGLKNVSVIKVDNLFKYYYGNETDYEKCKELLKEVKKRGYKSAFIVTFENIIP